AASRPSLSTHKPEAQARGPPRLRFGLVSYFPVPALSITLERANRVAANHRIPMGYHSLRACVADLERTGQLVRIEQEIDPHLEAAAIHRRVYQAGGPALYFARVKGCAFPMVSNLFGTLERTRFLFRDTLAAVRHLVELKVDPSAFWKWPWRYRDVPFTLWNLAPRFVSRGPILAHETTIGQLPQLQCWPKDGGAFITLP